MCAVLLRSISSLEIGWLARLLALLSIKINTALSLDQTVEFQPTRVWPVDDIISWCRGKGYIVDLRLLAEIPNLILVVTLSFILAMMIR